GTGKPEWVRQNLPCVRAFAVRHETGTGGRGGDMISSDIKELFGDPIPDTLLRKSKGHPAVAVSKRQCGSHTISYQFGPCSGLQWRCKISQWRCTRLRAGRRTGISKKC